MIVFLVNGILYFEEYKGFNPPLLDLVNVICYPRIQPFFQMLLEVFHIGIWSCMPPSCLDPVLAHLLLVELRSQLLFVYGQDKYVRRKPYCGNTKKQVLGK